MFAHLFFHVSPFLPSHISISSVKYADWGQLLGRLQVEHVIIYFPFWGFQDVAVKVNEKDFSGSGEILIRAIFFPHFMELPQVSLRVLHKGLR